MMSNTDGTTYFYITERSTAQGEWSITAPTGDAWHHIVVTYNNSDVNNDPIIYVDGVSVTVTESFPPIGNIVTTSAPYVLGNRGSDNARVWKGNLDEFRISNNLRSSSWITADYNSQKASSTFIAWGARTATDTTAPTITNVSSDKANGSYTTGEVIDIDVTFSEAVTSTGNVTVTLETGATDQTCAFTVTAATTGTCNYTVVSGDASADLEATISGTIADVAGNALSNFTPTTNLAANKALVIDTAIRNSSGSRSRVVPPTVVSSPTAVEENPVVNFISNLIPSFLKPKPAPASEVEPSAVSEKPQPSLKGEWKLISDSLIDNFVLAPLPSDIIRLMEKFPELARVFAGLGIVKITDLEKLRDVNINLPVITDKRNFPTEIIVVKESQGLITIGSSLVLTFNGEVEQKVATIAGKPIVFSLKPESETASIKGYLLFKRKAEKTAMEIPSNSLVANALLAQIEVAQISSETLIIEQELLIHSFEYTDLDKDGIFTVEISAPIVEGEYEVLTIINYKDKEKGSKELRMITIVDPEGYVYRLNNGEETRISNVRVSIWSISNGATSLWDVSKYNQDNPQITDNTGKYSFLVPLGEYYITALAKGYKSYQGDNFSVKEGTGVHFNIEMKEKGSWFKALVDWKMLIIIIFGIALLVNFINDRRRGK